MLGVAIGLSIEKIYGLVGGVGPTSSTSTSVQHTSHHYEPLLDGHSTFMQNNLPLPSSSTSSSTKHDPMDIPWMDEYIPPNLRNTYEPQAMQFNVTRSMLRQSRPVVGNVQRLHAYLRKLQSKQCTTVLILGGSISDGHHVKGGATFAYPQNFVHWLNERYPCLEPNGKTRGEHQWKKTYASNSQRHFTSWAMVSGIESFDLVILEFNVNDHFVSDLPHALEDKGPMGELTGESSL